MGLPIPACCWKSPAHSKTIPLLPFLLVPTPLSRLRGRGRGWGPSFLLKWAARPRRSRWPTRTANRSALVSAQGHPVALFFFCGCPWCTDAAHAWGQAQRARHLPKSTQTLIVFAGTSAAASEFATKNGLDRKQTTLLPDPDSAITEGIYKLTSCPRAFALDGGGVIRYTNDHPDDQPRIASAQTIVSRTQAALAQTGQFGAHP